jgi:hypothetical protein
MKLWPLYSEEVTCSVCGGKGVATPQEAALQWRGMKLRHCDRRDCEEELRRRKRKPP